MSAPASQAVRTSVGEAAGHDDLAVAIAHFDHVDIDGWCDDEFGSGKDSGSRGFGVEDGSGAEQNFVAQLFANG